MRSLIRMALGWNTTRVSSLTFDPENGARHVFFLLLRLLSLLLFLLLLLLFFKHVIIYLFILSLLSLPPPPTWNSVKDSIQRHQGAGNDFYGGWKCADKTTRFEFQSPRWPHWPHWNIFNKVLVSKHR